MARMAPDATLDEILDYIALSTIMTLCSAEPTTYTEATATYKLADVVIDGNDFSKANGVVSGRRLIVAAQSGVTIDASGTATHAALCTTSGSLLRFVTTMTSLALVAAGTVYIAEWDIEIRDPAAP